MKFSINRFTLFMAMAMLFIASPWSTNAQTQPPEETVQESYSIQVPVNTENKVDLMDVLEETIEALVNKDVEIILPDSLDPYNADSWIKWYILLTGLFSPVVAWYVNKKWPSSNKKQLILKSFGVAATLIVVALTIAGNKAGWHPGLFGQALFAFVLHVASYKGFWKGIGLKSPRNPDYYSPA